MQGVKGVVSANFQLRIGGCGGERGSRLRGKDGDGSRLQGGRTGLEGEVGAFAGRTGLENAISREILTPSLTLPYQGEGNNRKAPVKCRQLVDLSLLLC